jgi:hypothetical protein
VAIAPQQVKDREVGRGLAVGHGGAVEHQPALGLGGLDKLGEQPRLSHPCLAHHRHDLAVAHAGPVEGVPELLELGGTADEAGEAARGGRLEPRPHRASTRHLVDLHRLTQAPDGHSPQRLDLHQALDQPQHRRRDEDRARHDHLLHPGRQMRRLPHRGVVHAQVAADGPHHHLARVQPDADVEGHPMAALHRRGVRLHGLLHAQGSVAGAHRVVLMGQRRPKRGHDAVAHDLVDGAFVLVDGLHHALQHRIEEVPCLLGVPVGQEFQGPFQVGKQHGHLLAFAFQGTAGGQDLLGEIGWRVGQRRPCWGLRWHGGGYGSRASGARPDEDAIVLSSRDLLRIEEFVLEGFQGIVV